MCSSDLKTLIHHASQYCMPVASMPPQVGVGGVTGGYIAGVLSRFDRTGWIQVVAVLLFCFSIAAIGLSPGFYWALAACALSGLTEMIYSVTNMSMMQLAAPEEMRGRLTSILQLYPALISLGAFLVGPIADWIGPRATSISAASICAVVFVGIALASPRMRDMRMSRYVKSGAAPMTRH